MRRARGGFVAAGAWLGRGPVGPSLGGSWGGGGIEFPAIDLQSVDDAHVLVVAPADNAHVVRHVDVRAPGTSLWQVAVTDPPDPYIEYLQDGRWAVGGSNPAGGVVAAFGRPGDATLQNR